MSGLSSHRDLDSHRSSSRSGSSKASKPVGRRLKKYEQFAMLEVQKENEHLFAHLKQILTRPMTLAPQTGRKRLHHCARKAEAEQILTENQRLYHRINSQKPSIPVSELRENFQKHQELQQRWSGRTRSVSCPRQRLELGWRERMMKFAL